MSRLSVLSTLVLAAALTACGNEPSSDATSGGPPPTGLLAYPFSRAIVLTGVVPPAYSLALTFDHAALVKDKLAREDGEDVRLGLERDGEVIELNRVLDPSSDWNDAKTTIWFRSPDAELGTGTFRLYFGKPTPDTALDDPAKVYDVWEDFDDATFNAGSWQLKKFGNAEGKFETVKGALRLSGQSNDFAGLSDNGVFFYRSVSGDFTAVAAIAAVGGSLGGNAKAGGLMLRQNTDVDSVFAMASLRHLPRQRVSLARTSKGMPPVDGTELTAPDTFPQFVSVNRIGNDVSSGYSEDGRTWIGLGSAFSIKDLTASVFVGVPFSNLSSDFGHADIDWLRIIKRVNPSPLATLSKTE